METVDYIYKLYDYFLKTLKCDGTEKQLLDTILNIPFFIKHYDDNNVIECYREILKKFDPKNKYNNISILKEIISEEDIKQMQNFSNIIFVSIGFLITSITLLILKKIHNKSNDYNLKNTLLVGAFQCLSVFPGISRSGITMLGSKASKLDLNKGKQFTFLLLIPISIGSSILSLFEDANTLIFTDKNEKICDFFGKIPKNTWTNHRFRGILYIGNLFGKETRHDLAHSVRQPRSSRPHP
jgi:hypothetical protein